MIISIDYDDTFTADPDCWTEVIEVLKKYQHEVICVSARRNKLDNRQELSAALPKIPILLSYDEPKRSFALKAGYDVDVWIDDSPSAIIDSHEYKLVRSELPKETIEKLNSILRDKD